MATNRYWPKLWADNDALLKEARRIQYLVNITEDGKLACKACGAFVQWENPQKHFETHMAELDAYIGARKHASTAFAASKREGKREYASMSEVLDEAAIIKELGL